MSHASPAVGCIDFRAQVYILAGIRFLVIMQPMCCTRAGHSWLAAHDRRMSGSSATDGFEMVDSPTAGNHSPSGGRHGAGCSTSGSFDVKGMVP